MLVLKKLFSQEGAMNRKMKLKNNWIKMVRGAAVVAKKKSKTLEVVGSNPAECWTFFFSFLFYQLCVLNSDPSRKIKISYLPIKNMLSHAA